VLLSVLLLRLVLLRLLLVLLVRWLLGNIPRLIGVAPVAAARIPPFLLLLLLLLLLLPLLLLLLLLLRCTDRSLGRCAVSIRCIVSVQRLGGLQATVLAQPAPVDHFITGVLKPEQAGVCLCQVNQVLLAAPAVPLLHKLLELLCQVRPQR